MKARLAKITTFIFLSLMIVPAYSQKGIEDGSKFGHGEDSTMCLRNLSLYKTYYDQKNYEQALGYWRLAFNECPASSKNIYIHGVRMYKTLFRKSHDKAYIDTMNMVYDRRIEYFKGEADVEGRRGADLYNANPNDENFLNMAYVSLGKSFNLNKRKMNPNYMIVYMATTQKLFDLGTLTNEDVIGIYGALSDELDFRIANSSKPGSFQQAKDNIDLIFKGGGAGTCAGMIPYFAPKINENPNDIELLKKVLSLLEAAGCNDSELYYTAAEDLYQQEKSPTAAYHLAEMNADKMDYARAEKYYLEAIQLEEDKTNIANYYTKVASIKLGNKDYQGARDFAKKAIENDPKGGTPYMIIGNAYASVKPFSDDFENQTVFWVAVDYLIKARNIDPSLGDMVNETIAQLSGFFPTKSECFFRGFIEEGVSYRVGSWINESTSIRFRKE